MCSVVIINILPLNSCWSLRVDVFFFFFYIISHLNILFTVSVGHRAPPARSGHRCVADNSNLYVFGGYNPDFDESGGSENEDYPLFRELWRYHFATGSWQQIRTEGYMPTELASMSGTSSFHNVVVRLSLTMDHIGYN